MPIAQILKIIKLFLTLREPLKTKFANHKEHKEEHFFVSYLVKFVFVFLAISLSLRDVIYKRCQCFINLTVVNSDVQTNSKMRL